MTKEELIRNLKYTMEKHKNDTVNTFDTNISVMCKDILDYLEQEPKMGRWIRQKGPYGPSNSYECSVCGRVIYADTEEDLEDYPYCHCGAKMAHEKTEQVIDLSKPNSHLHEPLFPGLSWTARDFDILGTYLDEELTSYIEDKNGPLEDDCMKRLLEMKDECSEIYAASAYAKELSERLKLRKEQRCGKVRSEYDIRRSIMPS